MAKKAAKPVIKSLGKRTGAVSKSALTQIVRKAMAKTAAKKVGVLAVKDTATGSGSVTLVFGGSKSGSKRAA